MKLVERFIASKSGVEDDCEDGLVVTDDFVAVIDGATDKTGARYSGMTGGRYAMLACVDAITGMDRELDAVAAVGHLTEVLASRLPPDISVEQRPVASVGMYSVARHEVWLIGDIGVWHSGLTEPICPETAIDHFTSGLRSAILAAELLAGNSVAELARHDVGRDAIRPALIRQGIFCNNADAGEWAFSVINGQPVPSELISVLPLATDVRELVLASDGYPVVSSSLAQAEAELQRSLAEDPLRIGAMRSTKALQPGNISFDDRSFVKIAFD